MAEKLTVEKAAKLMGKTPMFIRMGLRQGRLPFGYAVKMPGGRWSYYINAQQFFQSVGVDENTA